MNETSPIDTAPALLNAARLLAESSAETVPFHIASLSVRYLGADAAAVWGLESVDAVPTLLGADERTTSAEPAGLVWPEMRVDFDTLCNGDAIDPELSQHRVWEADPNAPNGFASLLLYPIFVDSVSAPRLIVALYARATRADWADPASGYRRLCSEMRPHVVASLERWCLHSLLESVANARELPAIPAAALQHFANLNDAIARRSERETDRLKTDFVSTVSHELRTPLTIIKGYGDLLLSGQAGPITELQSRFLDAIQKNTARLTDLLNDLLDISQLEQGRMKLRWSAVDMARLVTETCAEHGEIARQRQIALHCVIGDRIPPVAGDSRRLRQALNNLLGNALKYSPAGTDVTVFCEVRAAEQLLDPDDPTSALLEVWIRVQDQGEGIPAPAKARIFEKFYRADASLTREVGGSGLGLAIAHQIVSQHGGRIWLEDGPGARGSVFAFALPVTHLANLHVQ